MAAIIRRGSYVLKNVRTLSPCVAASIRTHIPKVNYSRTTTSCTTPVFKSRNTSNFSIKKWFHLSACTWDSVTVNCPAFAESISEGDVRWEKAVGDSVEEDETVAEIETDKTSIPIPAPSAGVIESLLVDDGTTVTPGTALFKIQTDGLVSAKTDAPAEEKAALPPAPEPTPVVEAKPTPIPDTPPPPTPIATQPIATTKVSDIKISPVPSTPNAVTPGTRSEHRVKMNRMRLRIAQRLKDSQNTAAMLTTFNEVDMLNIMELRNKYKEAFLKKHGVKLSFMSAFIKASAYALQDQPAVNAVIDDEKKEIVYRDYVDVSVAVSTSKGLVVPVIRNCENMNYLDIEQEMTNLATKARNNELTVEDMDGGTFTISNGGVFGSLMGTPIINPPQSAILGMHGIFDRPVAVKGEVKIRPMMYIALTYDHRLVDGREAVTFLKKIKEAVEDPAVLLLGM
ncbi:dihydrolipoyllysine-residue succinyltransferase component of 2-oxoglutarate dehydrogenase complex, mitochondrial-like [Clavelina lepadiformis]|uniref:Dihydrolipoyllysine-residue succinyltransferase component of 2-oxoglutarate dehydrogenase complex, mitochondrial n=1 Tax=Clavelina lepadiformis TaxID=159417 RepID=A0ABP0F5R2_CLALP